MKKTILPKKFLEVSSKIGMNHLLVQGAGGNTSYKENNKMWIKASGTWLSQTKVKNIFVSIDLKIMKKKIIKNFESLENLSSFSKLGLRPSIETTMHALMPHKIVLHTHSVELLSLIVKKDAIKILEKLFKDLNWAWIPYVRPGNDLAKIVKNIIDKRKVDIIFFGNHGLMVGGKDSKSTYKLMIKVINRCRQIVRKFNFSNEETINNLAKKLKMRLPKFKITHSLATDIISFNYCKKNNGILWPDQTIFLGKKMNYCSIKKLKKNSLSYLIIRNVGVLVSLNAKKDVDEILRGHAEILLRIKSNQKLRYLEYREINRLHNWEAEKYRKKII
jgi:rhamnose utilization protein RhaD (predicted bifunctional aldolase and dehydrogenase)|tara:strand:+ start:388 stop:1383 length:996 start_codon:yes stop_codon:yes gene_type:complete